MGVLQAIHDINVIVVKHPTKKTFNNCKIYFFTYLPSFEAASQTEALLISREAHTQVQVAPLQAGACLQVSQGLLLEPDRVYLPSQSLLSLL